MTASVISESDRAPLPASYRDEPRHLAALAVAMTLVQLFDGIIGLRLNDPGRAYGPMVFAAINFGLLWWMKRLVATRRSASS